MVPVTCDLSPVICHLSPVTCHLSPVTCHLSPVTCHLSPVTCHLSPVTYSQRICRGGFRMRMTFAGTPATTALDGTSFVTTAFVPMIALSPTVTPRRMQAP